MTQRKKFRISVRDLVAVNKDKGDLKSGWVSNKRALEGSLGHKRIQAMGNEDYQREVSLSLCIEEPHFDLEIFGRADGVFSKAGLWAVEEIKTCQEDPAFFKENPKETHLDQLKCYGHIWAQNNGLERLCLVLTYAHTKSEKIARITWEISAQELTDFFTGLTEKYLALLLRRTTWKQIRNTSIQNLDFPFPSFREGQRELAESVFRIVKHEKILFARAPTGTGKTMATLYPALKALGLGHTDTLFYLTAKTPGKAIACDAVRQMGGKGLRLKSVVLTSKQQICFESDGVCDMDNCPYARGYYYKIIKAMEELPNHDIFDRDTIENIAEKYAICPFELSLDLSLEADLIICDFNYAFDPRVYLRRFFDQTQYAYTFLVDEAHNLPDRLRSMYSAPYSMARVKEIRDLISQSIPALETPTAEILSGFRQLLKEIPPDEDFISLDQVPDFFSLPMENFCEKADAWMERHDDHPHRETLLDFYFETTTFLNILDYFDRRYEFFLQLDGEGDLDVYLFCKDPSLIFSGLIKRSRSAVFFSATFFPRSYYQTILFGEAILPYGIELASPFPRENLGLFIHRGIETTYRHRHNYYKKIAEAIGETIRARAGNYLAFFPSYRYLGDVLDQFQTLNQADQWMDSKNILVQEPGMDEGQRSQFLKKFTPHGRCVGFCVLGGIFGEGIDFAENCLKGAIIVGVGLPQICPEQESIREYFDEDSNSGFFHAYRMPGFNRVLQAAGRVIRRESDKGVVVLLDRRFSQKGLRQLFPPEWSFPSWIKKNEELGLELKKFWGD